MDVQIVAPTLPTHGYSTVYVFPTISPHIVVIPILSCIFGFPVLVLLIICALRNRARKARLRAKRRRPAEAHTITEIVAHTSFNQSRYFNESVIRMKDGKRKTIVRFKPMPELDLDTVIEEKSEFDAEVSVNNELYFTKKNEPKERVESHTASFRSYRYGYGASGQLLNKNKLSSTPSIHINANKSNHKILEVPVCKPDNRETQTLKEVKCDILLAARENISLGCDNPCQKQICNVLVKDFESVNPNTSLGSTSTLRESSTTISSKEFDTIYPSSSTPWVKLNVPSPVRCHLKDIGGIKTTANLIRIKDKRIEAIERLNRHANMYHYFKENSSPSFRHISDSEHRNEIRCNKELTILKRFREYYNNENDNFVHKGISKSEEGLVESGFSDYGTISSSPLRRSPNIIAHPSISKSDEGLVEAVVRNYETIVNHPKPTIHKSIPPKTMSKSEEGLVKAIVRFSDSVTEINQSPKKSQSIPLHILESNRITKEHFVKSNSQTSQTLSV